LGGGPFLSCGCAKTFPATATDNTDASKIALLLIITLSTASGTRTL
jgi:hypothetical protein